MAPEMSHAVWTPPQVEATGQLLNDSTILAVLSLPAIPGILYILHRIIPRGGNDDTASQPEIAQAVTPVLATLCGIFETTFSFVSTNFNQQSVARASTAIWAFLETMLIGYPLPNGPLSL